MTNTPNREAFEMMLDIVNEWHLKVGIDDIMKSKLTKAIADTVATGVVQKHIDRIRAESALPLEVTHKMEAALIVSDKWADPTPGKNIQYMDPADAYRECVRALN